MLEHSSLALNVKLNKIKQDTSREEIRNEICYCHV